LGHIRTHLPKQYKTNELTQMLMSGEPSFAIAIITPEGEYEMRDISDVQRDLIETMSIAKRITEGR